MYLIFVFILSISSLWGGCPFCDPKVIQKQAVFESEHFYVLADYAPIVYGHVLIVPKQHVVRLSELDPAVGSELLVVYNRVNDAFKSLFQTTDSTIIEKNGPAAGQSVPHVHFHVLPMRSDDWPLWAHLKVFFRILFGSRPVNDAELSEIVGVYRNYYNSLTMFTAEHVEFRELQKNKPQRKQPRSQR